MKKIVLFIALAYLLCSCYRYPRPVIKGYEDDFVVDVTVQYIYGSDTLSNLYDWQSLYKYDGGKQEHALLVSYIIKGNAEKITSFSCSVYWMILDKNNNHVISSNLSGSLTKRSNNLYQINYKNFLLSYNMIPELKKEDKFIFKVRYYLSMKKKFRLFNKSKLIKREEFIKTFSVGDNTTEL